MVRTTEVPVSGTVLRDSVRYGGKIRFRSNSRRVLILTRAERVIHLVFQDQGTRGFYLGGRNHEPTAIRRLTDIQTVKDSGRQL